MRHWFLLFLVASPLTVLLHAKHVDLPAPFKDECILEKGQNLYDPAGQFDIKWYNIDLDQPASERWRTVATEYGDNIGRLIGVITGLILPIFPGALDLVDEIFGEMNDKLPQPYRDEIASIAKYSGVPLGQVVLYNIFYEIFTVCTSIVAQDTDGEVYHARNLDFGLFLGWDPKTHDWMISSVLRTMIININWIKDGKILYKSNNFAGFVGVYNGLKPNAFSLTANERFMAEGGYIGMIRWMLGMEPNGKWMTWHVREVMEEATSYADAKDKLMNTPILSPVYYILGGINPYEGSIITRSLDKTDRLDEMTPKTLNGWYVLQTNYDPEEEPLFLDDRQTPGDKCMQYLTKRNVNFQGMYNVLSSRTNLNKLTTYTVLMHVRSGRFETHLQSCPGECWPF